MSSVCSRPFCSGLPAPSNLKYDAVKYSLPTRPRAPGVTRTVGIVVRGEPQQRWVAVKITNLGWAIPDDLRDVIFEPWVRGYVEQDAEALAGMGLGLFLARRLISAHGGEIHCTSRPTDEVYVPRKNDASPPPRGVPRARPEPVRIHETTFEVRIPRDLTPGVTSHRAGTPAEYGANGGNSVHSTRGSTV